MHFPGLRPQEIAPGSLLRRRRKVRVEGLRHKTNCEIAAAHSKAGSNKRQAALDGALARTGRSVQQRGTATHACYGCPGQPSAPGSELHRLTASRIVPTVRIERQSADRVITRSAG
jgi:hypothetical protein